jgi:drug/metabolite transporter (DMT)-like permease
MRATDWLLLFLLGMLWGGSFFFAAVALAELPPFTIVLSRVGIAAIVLWSLLPLLRQRMPRDAVSWRAFLVMGALNNAVPFSLIVWGQSHIASGLAAILNAMTPLFTVALAHVLTADERMTAGKVAGVIFGLVGVTVVVGPDALGGLGTGVLSELAVLGAALCYAAAGLYGRRFRRMGLPPLVTATGQVTAAAAMLLLPSLLLDRPWLLPPPSLATWGALLGSALFCTALGYVVYFRLLASAGATNLLLVTFLIPVSAILLGALVLGEQLAARHFLGMAAIALGLAAIDGRMLARLRMERLSEGPAAKRP